MPLTRRTVLGSAAGLLPLVAKGAEESAAASTRVRLVLLQLPWKATDPARDLARRIAATGTLDTTLADGLPVLCVLPPATAGGGAPAVAEVHARLSRVARICGVHLAGAATVHPGADGAPRTEGFLIGSEGQLLLRAPKIMPDVLAGFSDTAAELDRPADFPVVRLPFGAVGMLVGEDVFRGSHVRALCFNGAEILLNCALEVADPALPARRDAMAAVAYCHVAFVAAATGPAPTRTGLWDWSGASTVADGAAFLSAVLDVERLRMARHEGTLSSTYASRILPPMVRDGLYGPVFAAAAAARGARSAPATRAGWLEEAGRRLAAQARRTTPEHELLAEYDAVIVQSAHRRLAGATDRRAAIAQNIREILAQAEPYASRPLSKLVLIGEFAFTGAGWRTIPDALSVALSWPGPELAQIAEFAARHGVYVAAQQIELDLKFPGRVFNTAFLFDAAGNLASRHRKLQCVDLLGTFPDTTPGSIHDRYVAEYGEESLWQVVDTPLGRLAPLIAIESMFPEVAQIYAQQGAEVYLQLSSEGWDTLTDARYAWDPARRQHAFEASAWFLAVNEGDDPALRDPYHVVGQSHAIDPYGRVTAMLRESHPGVLVARVDLGLLRAARADPRGNLGIWDEPAVYAAAYRRGLGVANNLWAGSPGESPYRDLAVYRETVRRYDAAGVFTPPRRALQGFR